MDGNTKSSLICYTSYRIWAGALNRRDYMSDFNIQNDDSRKPDFSKLDATTKEKLDAYNQKKARNMSIAVFLYIFSVAFLIFFAAMFGEPILGVTGMFVCIAVATGLIVYTTTLVPVDLIPYVKGAKMPEFKMSHIKSPRKFDAFFKLYWMIVTIVYLGVSFHTGRWGITWLIWLIAAAVKEAIYLFAGAGDDSDEE